MRPITKIGIDRESPGSSWLRGQLEKTRQKGAPAVAKGDSKIPKAVKNYTASPDNGASDQRWRVQLEHGAIRNKLAVWSQREMGHINPHEADCSDRFGDPQRHRHANVVVMVLRAI